MTDTDIPAKITKPAQDKAVKAAAAVADALPMVLDTAEVSLEIPTKVVVNQKLVFVVGVVSGAGLAAAGYWGFQKFQSYRRAKKVDIPDDISSIKTSDKN